MRVTLRLFAALREELGTGFEALDLPDHVTTVGGARAFLAARSAAWQALLAPRVRSALDQRLANDASALHEGAELAFFPPVTGG
jgi:molybdopterin synthase sulfur carrier subunit